jgi:hypothetical protein
MAFKITLLLKETSAPHLYIDKIKEMMIGDTYLHPLMKNTLLMMKKTRMPYVLLATVKDIIFVPERNYHLERGFQPRDTGWFKIDWTEKEIQESKTNFEVFKAKVLDHYVKLGYNITKPEELPLTKIDEIIKTLKKKC